MSSGPVPFLKIYNDVAVAVNQGGKRKGAFAPYLELWHADIYDFIDLKKKTGDEHLRTHDIFPAIWANDLFFERLREGGQWSLFCPNEVPELLETYGDEFKATYEKAEAEGKACKVVQAEELWRYWLDALFRTGAPWITFKDECNRRNPQGHVGFIHNSNLCTEITLNNSEEETFVCNLGSINLSRHIRPDGSIDLEKLKRTVRTAMRMLDNVIDLNYYPTENSRRSNLRHRPVGLGVMGYAEALIQAGIDWESEEHLDFADQVMEAISYFAIDVSCQLAEEKGHYESFPGSTWSKGQLTIDHAREKSFSVFTQAEWDALRERVKRHGVRNSNMIAIAPTATIANITGTTEGIQSVIDRVEVKENLSGSFKVISPLLRYGKPHLVKTMFEIDPEWVIRAAAKRQKWIDQAQSLNIFKAAHYKGRDISKWYQLAWELGLKTTYYLKVQTSKGDTAQVGKGFGSKNERPAVPANSDWECEACQ